MPGRRDNQGLEAAAREAWTLAHTHRRAANWGQAVAAANRAAPLLRDPHPGIRRLAAGLFTRKPEDRCA